MNTKYNRFSLSKIWTVMLIGLILRIFWAVIVPIEATSDSSIYRDFALSISNGRGYSYPSGQLTAYWPVGTSAFYAGVNLLFGYSHISLIIVNIIIGECIILMTYLLARQYFDIKIPVFASLIVAIWPVLIQFTTVYSSEQIFILLILITLFVWGTPDLKPMLKGCIYGTTLCMATYVRPTALPIFILLPALYFYDGRGLKNSFVMGFAAIFVSGLLFAPWVVRNQQLFGQPVLVSTNFGSNLWMGNNPLSNGAYMPVPFVESENEVTKDKYFRNLAIEYIVANPVAYFKLSLNRFKITFDRETIGIAWNEPALRRTFGEQNLYGLKILSTIFWWLVLVFSLSGFLLILIQKKMGLSNPIILVSSLFVIIPILTVGQDRYHLPLNPFLAMFAAYAFQLSWFRLRNKK